MPSVPLPGTTTAPLRHFLTKPAPPHVPAAFASPCAPAGSAFVPAAPPLQPLVALAGPEVQNERSPCLAASIATVTMPAAANESAASNMSARPRPRPWRKIIIGAHLPNALSGFGARSEEHTSELQSR